MDWLRLKDGTLINLRNVTSFSLKMPQGRVKGSTWDVRAWYTDGGDEYGDYTTISSHASEEEARKELIRLGNHMLKCNYGSILDI